MHISRLAPLLSATFSMVLSWIMSAPYSARARSTTRTSTHDLRRDIGRHGLIETVSPSLHSLFSSCASSLVVRRMYLPYIGCLTRRSTETATVLSILLLTTLPVSRRCPGTGAGPATGAGSATAVFSGVVDIKPYLRLPYFEQAPSLLVRYFSAPSQIDPALLPDRWHAPCAN